MRKADKKSGLMEEMDTILDPIRNSGGVEVMKASAGSGKTFSLAREYIRILLKNRNEDHPYRHILAVTFTNKATAEMKSRIIEALDTISRFPEQSLYKDYLMEHCDFNSIEEFQKAGSAALADILGDYGAFSVSTIDHFFQRVLRAFAREVGQFSEYQIELDRKSLVEEATDRVLDSLSESDETLLKWLSRSFIEDLTEGEGYKLREKLGRFASGYMSESYREKAREIGAESSKPFSEDNLKRLLEICDKIVNDFDESLKDAAKKDLPLALGEEKPDRRYLIRWLETIAQSGGDGAEQVLSTSSKVSWTRAVERGVVPNVESYRGRPFQTYKTAILLRKQVSVFLVAEALDKQFAELLNEKNVLSIDDTNTILRDIIGGSDAPFIYEKVGVRYNHFLLDEFQDTSSTQWENFRPLLEESISNCCYNLIVGDVKQSIYRWRNAKWDILDEKVEESLKPTVLHPLLENRRSADKIILFNNDFFKTWAEKMDNQLNAELAGSQTAIEASKRSISKIYSDVEQKPMGEFAVPGSVEVVFCGEAKNKVAESDALIYERVVAAVQAAENRGFKRSDIAVLVRTNLAGQEIASRLTAQGKQVVSNDSMRIDSGWTVKTLASMLFKIDNPADKINTFFAEGYEPEALDGCLSLVDLVEKLLSSLPEEKVNADTLYVLAFMDLLRDYVSRNGNSLHSFLQYWEEKRVEASIASPDGTDAITITTIHAAKGLAFPYVILPVVGEERWIKNNSKSWEAPDVKGTPFEKAERALYNTGLSSETANTLFAENYLRELRLRYIDTVNMWYVAATRAAQALHIVCPMPPDNVRSRQNSSPWVGFTGLSQALYQYCTDKAVRLEKEKEDDAFLFGTISRKSEKKNRSWKKPMPPKSALELKYYSAGSSKVSAREQVKIKTDSSDFFAPEGEKGVSASRRLRGTVLHGILETVIGPEDLHASVGRAVEDGLLSAEEARDAEQMLGDAIANVADRGWFPGDKAKLMNERDLITPSGEYKRPDRVVLKDDGSVEIVDYKFAMEKDSYVGQVQEYVASYKAMGYKDVRGYLWYVDRDYVSEV